MIEKEDKSTQACQSPDYYVVTIDGQSRRIAHDKRQPGGPLSIAAASSVVEAVFEAAREIRERDAGSTDPQSARLSSASHRS